MLNNKQAELRDFADKYGLEFIGRLDEETVNEIDFELLREKLSESDYLSGIPDVNFFVDKYYQIIKDKYKNFK